jgi:hypothetical protein
MTSKYTNPKEGQISNKLIELDHKIQLNAVRITIHACVFALQMSTNKVDVS